MAEPSRPVLAVAAVATTLGRALTAIGDAIRNARLSWKSCTPYYCPTSGDTECCPEHSGWDVCCHRPDLHRVIEVDAKVRRG